MPTTTKKENLVESREQTYFIHGLTHSVTMCTLEM
jgi:hypothetical protein